LIQLKVATIFVHWMEKEELIVFFKWDLSRGPQSSVKRVSRYFHPLAKDDKIYLLGHLHHNASKWQTVCAAQSKLKVIRSKRERERERGMLIYLFVGQIQCAFKAAQMELWMLGHQCVTYSYPQIAWSHSTCTTYCRLSNGFAQALNCSQIICGIFTWTLGSDSDWNSSQSSFSSVWSSKKNRNRSQNRIDLNPHSSWHAPQSCVYTLCPFKPSLFHSQCWLFFSASQVSWSDNRHLFSHRVLRQCQFYRATFWLQ